MNDRISSVAADSRQYDREELVWTNEGSKDNPNRRLFLKYLQPTLVAIQGKHVLDIGCGQGWLCDEIVRCGGVPLGLEPSERNVLAAHKNYPKVKLVRTSLQDFVPNDQFDVVLMVMVETFLDLEAAFRKVSDLLTPDGRFITVVSDFERSTHVRTGYRPETEVLGPGEVAIRINSGKRFGVLCDIIRTIDRYTEAAGQAGLTLRTHTPILPEPWHPRHETHKDKPLFHLLEFIQR
jgi:SAM-dependent methyltransferase